jgi:DNA-binding MarR family transcriptional regulator
MKRQRQGGFLIAKIHQLAGRIFNRMLKENDITELNTAQGRIMFVLWRDDGIPISELAEKTGLEKSTLTSMLDRLEKAGLLRRTVSATDRRKILIFRTDKDKSFEAKYVQLSQEMTRIFYRGFAEQEITRFEGDLERILDNLTSEEEGR